MTSEIRANTLKNRVGLGTVSFTNTGPVVSGIVTIANSTAAGVTLEDNAGVGNSLKITTPTGYVSVGAGNATFAHLQTDRGIFYFNRRISVDEGIISSYDEDLVLQSPMNTNRVTINKTTGLFSILNDLDVDGHTNLDNVSIAGVTTFSGNLDANGVVYVRQNASPTIYLTSNSTTGGGRLFFGDPDSDLVGRLSYTHNGDYFTFYAGYGERFRIAGNGDITVTSIDANATGPTLKLFHNSGSPAANDVVSRISMFGDDAAGNETEYGRIETKVDSVTDGQETSHINFAARGYGSFANVFRIKRRSTGSAPSYTTDDADGIILDVYNTGNPYPRYMNFIAKSAGNTDSNISLWTEAVGGSPTEKLRITSAGLVQTIARSSEVRRMILSGSPSNSAFNIEAHDGETGTSSGDVQGKLGLFYNDGSTLTNTACISFERGSSAADGAITFVTNQNERLRITSGGVLTFPTAGIGLHNSNTNSYFFSQGSNETRLYHAANNQVKLAFRKNGDVYQGAVNADDNGIGFFTKSSGSSGEEWGIRCKPDSETELFYNGNVRLFTTNYGISVNTNTLIAATDADDLQIGTGSGTAGMTIYSGTSSNGAIYFGDGTGGTNPYSGFLQYYHNSNSFGIGTLGGEKVLINSVGRVFHRNTTNFNREAYTKGGTVHGGGDATGKDSINPGAFAFINETPVRGSNSRYSFWIQTGDAYPNASNFIDFTVQNAYMYRVLIKGSHSSATADIAQFLIYGLANSSGNLAPLIEQVTTTTPSFNGDSGGSGNFGLTSGSFSCRVMGYGTSGGTRGSTGTYDTTLRIEYSGNNNQGLIAFIERWDTGT